MADIPLDLSVRPIIGITFLLLGIGSLFCHFEGQAVELGEQLKQSPWVRTVDGWERTDSWFVPAVRPPTLHPLAVAAAQALLSVFALALCEREATQTGRNG